LVRKNFDIEDNTITNISAARLHRQIKEHQGTTKGINYGEVILEGGEGVTSLSKPYRRIGEVTV
jgi:hypothetical protein